MACAMPKSTKAASPVAKSRNFVPVFMVLPKAVFGALIGGMAKVNRLCADP
jgi:hypothetical protein